jgi:hypothetical protein
MEQQIAEAIAPLIALLGIGTFTLLGLRMYLGYRTKRLELSAGQPSAHLEEAIEELRHEVQGLRGDVGELQERVDFAERLLTRGQEN